MLCRKCNNREIELKKHGLCKPCYQSERRQHIKEHGSFGGSIIRDMPVNKREIEFLISRSDSHLIYDPARFNLGDTSYSPDFYDVEKNIFIEVAGSRQAYSKNKHKYKIMAEKFPLIKLEVRLPDGRLLSDVEHGKKWSHQKT